MLLLAAVAATAAVGCADDQDPFGPEPVYATVERRFEATGELTSANAAAAFAHHEEEQKAAGAIALGGPFLQADGALGQAWGDLRSQALHLLELAERGRSTDWRCAAIEHGDVAGECACPTGGRFLYDLSGARAVRRARGPASAVLKVRFDACAAGDVTIDGREIVRVETQAGRELDGDASVLVVTDVAIDGRSARRTFERAARIAGGEVESALEVGSGWVTFRVTGARGSAPGSAPRVAVRDRNGTWACEGAAGHGSCTRGDAQLAF